MQQTVRTGFCRIMLSGLLVASMACRLMAGWNGAGVTGGTGGTDVNDPANWTGGLINNDYTAITGNAALQLTADHTPTNGLNFGTASSALCDLTLNGTKTLTLNASWLPAYPSTGNVMLASEAVSTLTLGKELTLNLAPSGHRYLIGSGQLVVDSLITGAGGFRITKGTGSAPFLHLRNKANSFTGEPSPIAGLFYFTSVADSGVLSALGAGSSLYCQTCSFIYNGTRDCSSNRKITLLLTPIFRNDSACGSLSLTGKLACGNNKGQHNMGFSGISSGTNLLEGCLANYSGTYLTKLTKYHSGTWRLTGTNTFTGWAGNDDISVLGGTLIADYTGDSSGAGSNRVFVAGRSLLLNNGELNFRGKAGTGNTTFQEMGVCTVEDYSASTLVVDANGGDGTTVELASFESVNTSSLLLIDLKGNAKLRTASAIPTSGATVRLVNGVLMNNNGADALFLIRDPDGRIGFPAQAADLSIVRHTNTLALTESNAATYAGDHLSLAADVTRTANLSFSTLVIDARANAVTLDMGGKSIQTSDSSKGRGIVAYGSHPVAVTNGTHGAQISSYLFNYGTGKFIWDIVNSKVYTVGGTGLVELRQTFSAYLTVMGATARLATNMIYTGGTVRIMGDGVVELGADLNGEAPGDYTGALGSSAGGIIFNNGGSLGGGGFSAYGRDRTVNLGGAGAKLTWGITAAFISDGKPFVLSSPYADATLIFENPLDLYTFAREFRVRNGSAAVDARLTGRISSGYVAGSLVKSGDGTLELTGAQAYRGNVSVIGGGLRLGADDVYAGGTNALVLSGATLDAGTNRNAFATLEILADSVIAVGDGTAELAFADSTGLAWDGTLTISGTLGANTLRFGTDGTGLTPAQIAAMTNRGCNVRIDAQGYLHRIPPGTLISVR